MQKKRVFIFTVCLALLIAGFSVTVTNATTLPKAGDAVFKTPEDAITAYMEGVAQGDINKIYQACAINEMSENFKFDLYIDRVRAFTPFQSEAPSNYPFFVDLNKTQVAAQIATQVKILAYSLLSTEKVNEGTTIIMDLDKANTFIQSVDPKRLANLEIKKIVIPSKKNMDTAQYRDNAAKRARVYMADELTERVVLFSFEQNYYALGFTLLRYGDNWKIISQNSPMANTPALGAAQKITVEAFDSMFKQ